MGIIGANKMPKVLVRKIEQVNEAFIKEIVQRIVAVTQPEKIILFGSYAYGRPAKISDVDILVIMKSDRPRYKRAVPIYKELAGLLIPKDILVYTPQEVEEWADVPQSFITTIIRKGKVVYEKK